MKEAKLHPEEQRRLEMLRSLQILDTLPEQQFDDITLLASQICQTPIALISLVDENRQWFKSKVGLDATQTPRNVAFCSHAILQQPIFEIKNSALDERFRDNPLVTGAPSVQFYAGVPLLDPLQSLPLGTLCVIDQKPNQLSPAQKKGLEALSRQITTILKFRLYEEQEIEATTVLNAMSEGLVIQNEEGRIEKFNPEATQILELSEDQLTGRSSMDPRWKAIRADGSPFPGEEHPAMVALRTNRPAKGAVMGLNLPSGGERWIKINSIPFTIHKTKKVASTFSDISALVFASEELKRSLKFKDTLLKSARLAIITTDENDTVTSFNPEAERILGYLATEVVGKTKAKSFYCVQESSKVADEISRQTNKHVPPNTGVFTFKAKSQGFDERNCTFVGKNEKRISVSVITTPLLDEAGAISGYLRIAKDRTAELALEAKIAEERAKSIQSAKLASLGEMSAGLAHEINNPLAIIAGNIDLLLKLRNDTEKFESKIGQMKNAADRMTKIIRGLKKFSRTSESVNQTLVDVKSAIENSTSLISVKAKHANVTLKVNVSTGIKIQANEIEIEQVFINLLNNAIDAVMDLPVKWVEIRSFTVGEELVVQILDSGSGLTKEIETRLFQPFFTTKPVGQGTGLGLCISKGILESQGATIKLNRGMPTTCFEIRFPKYLLDGGTGSGGKSHAV